MTAILHFPTAPVSIDKEQLLLWVPNYGATVFENWPAARAEFEAHYRDREHPRMFRFNPACPEETRDITTDMIPDDEPEDEDRPYRSQFVTSTHGNVG